MALCRISSGRKCAKRASLPNQGGFAAHCISVYTRRVMLAELCNDFFRYLKAVIMHWLQGFWFLTAIPEIFTLFSPARFRNFTSLLDRYVPPGTGGAIALALSIFGLFYASFRAWREADRQIGLRARMTQINPGQRGASQTRIFVTVEIYNSGTRSVATDWKLFMGRKSARASERTFHGDDNVQFDPQATPMEQGTHAFGTLLFQTNWGNELERKHRRLRLTFQDAARRTLTAADERQL